MINKKKLSILIFSNQDNQIMNLQKFHLEKLDHKVNLYQFRGHRNFKKYIEILMKIRNLDSTDYDIIHAFFGSSGFIANFQRNIPVITTFMGSDLLGEYKINGKYDYLFSLITFITSFFAQILSKKLISISKKLSKRIYYNNKHKLIKLGVDSEHFQPIEMYEARKKLNWDDSILYVLFPAMKKRIIKRYDIAKEIIDKISIKHKSIKLISLDEPNMYPNIPLIMNACNAMIFVSIHEGSPCVVKEAMACNLPIFSFDIGDVNEYAGHLKPGHVAKNNNKIELYEKLLLHLSSDPNKRSNGRTKIEKLSWDIYAIEVEKIYFETLGIDTNA